MTRPYNKKRSERFRRRKETRGKRLRGRPKKRWIDVVEEQIKWREIIDDRERCGVMLCLRQKLQDNYECHESKNDLYNFQFKIIDKYFNSALQNPFSFSMIYRCCASST